MMESKFPHIMNGAKAIIRDDKLTFTYIDSYADVITETKPMLTPMEVCQKVIDRMERFKCSGPGVRESEISRAERKWISAHPEKCLKKAWDQLDEYGKMEMSMMLSMDSHHGISDPGWAKKHTDERHEIVGDNEVPL